MHTSKAGEYEWRTNSSERDAIVMWRVEGGKERAATREHRRERSCQGERAVLESERHHEYKRDALGGESALGAEAKREGTDGGE